MSSLPSAEQLRIGALGAPRWPSPLRERGVRFVDESAGVLVAADTAQLQASRAGPGGAPAAFEPAGPRERIFFEPAETTCGIVTCGGLCPGINDVIRAIVLNLWHEYGVRRILGFRYGYAGLGADPEREPTELDPGAVHDIHTLGGTILGSSRGPQDVSTMVDTLEHRGVDILFTIGGDGTFRGAIELVEEIERRGLSIAVVGVPKTIDNDLQWIQRSFGFATAVNEATRSIIAAHTEARGAWNGVGLVKLMGRYSGLIAAHATLSNSQVNFCLVPEVEFEIEGPGGFLELLEARLASRHHAMIVLAEGAGQQHVGEGEPETDASGNPNLGDIGGHLRAEIKRHFRHRDVPVAIKYIDPSYLIRSLPANAFDSALCLSLGQHAVHAGMSGRTGLLVGSWRDRYTHVPFELATDKLRRLDPEGATWQRVLEATGQPRRIGPDRAR